MNDAETIYSACSYKLGKHLSHGSASHSKGGYRRVPSLLHCYPAWVE